MVNTLCRYVAFECGCNKQKISGLAQKATKRQDKNYCRMTSDLMDDVQEDVRWMSGSRTDDIEQISNKYQTYY